jgi:hypothetical protein
MEHTCPCGAPATFRSERVVPGGEPILGATVGQWQHAWWCTEHAGLLVRTTDERYRLVQLTSIPRGTREIAGQQKWDFPEM